MNSEKKAIIKRLAIFLLISFPPFMILVPVLWSVYGEPLYTGTDEKYAVIIYIVSVFGMMIPAMANLITRLVTKEGFSDSYLGVHVKGKTDAIKMYAVVNAVGVRGPADVHEMREFLGWDEPNLSKVSTDEEEKKYKIDG